MFPSPIGNSPDPAPSRWTAPEPRPLSETETLDAARAIIKNALASAAAATNVIEVRRSDLTRLLSLLSDVERAHDTAEHALRHDLAAAVDRARHQLLSGTESAPSGGDLRTACDHALTATARILRTY